MKLFVFLLISILSLTSEELKIVGKVTTPKIHTLESLKKLVNSDPLNTSIYCASGELRVPECSFEGVSLKTLLLDAGITNQRRAGNRTFIVITARDGFSAVFSWAEIMQDEESPVFLVFSQNQMPLDEKHGPFRLIATTDQKNGTRSIFGIAQIAVREMPIKEMDFQGDLELKGKIRETYLNLSEIRSMPVSTIQDLVMTSSSGEIKEKIALLEGVSLQEILQKHGITQAYRAGNSTVIVLHASDGYQVLYSWHELMNRKSSNHALIAYQRDQKPLGEKQGPLMSVSKQHNGQVSRQIRWLKGIEVRTIWSKS